MAKKDYYDVLGLKKDAEQSDIKNAFRKQAKQYHPDLHPDDKEAEAKFKEINEAYEVLSDPEKRAKYDQFGHAAFDQTAGGAGFNTSGFGFGDIFEQVFGGGFGGFTSSARSNGPVRGNDLEYEINISFEEAAFGVQREIQLTREENCTACNGSGAKPGTTPKKCSTCGGTGQVRVQQNTVFGSFATVHTCSTCNGTGKVVDDPCTACRGRGRVNKTNKLVVKIPAGINNGQSINIRGEGEAGSKGGPNGDLYVTVRVKPHKQFTRKGYDLFLDLDIPITTAVLGGEIQIPVLKGSVKYNIPEGTQPNTTFRLREQGIVKLNSSIKGDMFVKVNVSIPKKLTDEQREHFIKFADAFDGKSSGARANRKGFMGKMKDAFTGE